MSCPGCDSLLWRGEYDDLRDAVLDYARGVITLDELLAVANGRALT